MIAILVFSSVAALILIWAVLGYNRLTSAQNLVDAAFADIDVHLFKRLQLVPNLVALTKSYADYENKLLNEIVEKRAQSMTLSEKAQGDNIVSSAMKELTIIFENYPELKANQQFLQLMTELKVVEDHLLFARRFYNGTTRAYNTDLQSFPRNIIAKIFGFRSQPLYAVSDTSEREIHSSF